MEGFSGEAALQLLKSMADHVQQSLTDLSEIQPPQVAHEQNIAQINNLLHQGFERLCEPQAGDTSTIKNTIVQYSGERRIMEMNGLRDAENTCRSQVAAVLQTLSNRLVATLPTSMLDQSRQNLATGALEPYLIGDLRQRTVQIEPHSANGSERREVPYLEFPNGDRNEIQQVTEQAESREPERRKQNKERVEPNKTDTKLSASTVSAEQRLDNEQRWPTITRPDAIYESTATYHERAEHDCWDPIQDAVFLKIIDADGFPRGGLKQVESSGSRRVDTILRRPIRRPVQLRRGRFFSSDHLSAICKNGVKIVSCMIQASGDVMENRCTYCRKKSQGPFDQCIIVRDNAFFRRCGNCEWVRGRCQGASTAAETQMTPVTEIGVAAGPLGFSVAQGRSKSPAAEDPRNTDSALTDDTPQSCQPAMPTPPVIAAVAVAAVPETHWRICQIKTRNFSSAESTTQLWCWVEEEGSLKHLLLSKMEWKHLQCPVDFDVKLQDVAEVRASVESWRVRLILKDLATCERQEVRRGDVMVVFEGRKAVQNFLQFCHDQGLSVSTQEPPVMVTEWRNMASEYTLTGEEQDC